MGFIKEIYSDNRAGLVVAFGRGQTSNNYFDGDSAEEAMKHFNIYLKGNEMYIKTEDETAIDTLGIKKEDAIEFRSTVDAIITTLTDEQAIAAPVLFPIWQAGVEYKVGDRVRYNNKLYKVVQDHTSQNGWEPIIVASLYASLLIDEVNNTILDWIQPESTNPYMLNDKVYHNGKFWISTINNNTWEPDVVNTLWIEYITKWENGVSYRLNQKVKYEEIIYISLIDNNSHSIEDENYWIKYIEEPITEETPSDEITEWKQPSSTNGYALGDKVSYEGLIYESLIDNNVWSPNDYPAGWQEIIE